MCRSIKTLRLSDRYVSSEEMRSAALQYVRKVSGFHKPSKRNQEAFDRAVFEIAGATERLLLALGAQSQEAAAVAAGDESR
jgi:hypothetical protein